MSTLLTTLARSVVSLYQLTFSLQVHAVTVSHDAAAANWPWLTVDAFRGVEPDTGAVICSTIIAKITGSEIVGLLEASFDTDNRQRHVLILRAVDPECLLPSE